VIKNLFAVVIAIGLLIVIAGFVTEKAGKSDFDAAKEVIVMREIAHQVLQSAGDSTSQVLPVNRLSANEYKIPFETSFSFKSDSLVNIIDQVIAANKLPSKYIVNVLKYNTDTVIYGYARLGPRQDSIVPCRGRNQPALRYCIDIKFRENRIYTAKNFYIGGISLCGIGLLMFGFNLYKKKDAVSVPGESHTAILENTGIAIGKYIFFANEQILKFNEEVTLLTAKESKILSIFANAPNQIIERKRLQKEIWEDEGVIVGRSLDMFISRLRKKLENDPGLKIVNIHSKGYKLEINN
jgi:hypothetical protein